jgi:hypothetical protein
MTTSAHAVVFRMPKNVHPVDHGVEIDDFGEIADT